MKLKVLAVLTFLGVMSTSSTQANALCLRQ